MDLNEYQRRAHATAVGNGLDYLGFGLCEEAGEVAGHLKRLHRDDGGQLTADRREKIKLEIGDTLWYLSQVAHEIGFTLEDIAQANLEKIAGRVERGTLHGSGDDR